jgi:SAM-dependent methyltransferase
MPKNPTAPTDWYDFPHYYDVAMRGETRSETAFVEAACRKYCPFPARRLLEPACGTGRVLTALAARGYRMTGVDRSEPSLEYLRRRLARRRLKANILRADMAAFRLPRPVDAAYCLLNSFRHLADEASARGHLECVAASLRPGGIYLLGMHLLPPDAAEECIERWTESHRNTRVTVTFRVLGTDRRRRVEQIRVSVLARQSGRTIRLRHEFPLRMYTAAQFRRLLASVPSLELCDVYDFWYELDRPLRLSNELSDVVFVLRRRATA